MSTEDVSRVKHSFGDGPLVPPSDLEFLYSPSAATCGSYVHTLQKTKDLKRVNRNQVAYPKGTNPGHIIYQKGRGRAVTSPECA